jgi:transcriptional regulator GlxA family with amidase domain
MARDGDPVVDWIRSAHEHTTYTTAVCTGTLLLGAAGLLDGLQATTHWVAYDELRRYGARPTEQRVVFEDRIVTGAGVSAGIDLALEVVARLSGPRGRPVHPAPRRVRPPAALRHRLAVQGPRPSGTGSTA